MSILFYRRPTYVSKEGGPMTASSCQRYAEKGNGNSSIPPSLSFEKVIGNKTMPPCSLQDFLDYLIYVAYDAENLQFYLWLQDYKRRFDALPATEKALSPPWAQENIAPDLRHPGATSIRSTADEVLDKDVEAQYLANLKKIAARKNSAPPTPPSKDYDGDSDSILTPTHAVSVMVNFETSRRWNASTAQPFRNEINQIITHYFLPNSPRELNLSHKARASLLSALHRTTHPSALASVESLTLLTLRHHAHPNFIRWSLCNGNRPRVFLLRTLAASWLVLFAAASTALVLSSHLRWYRIALAPLLWVGVTNLIAAAKGLCILLHRLHTRELRPWELEYSSLPAASAPPGDVDFAEQLAKGHHGGGGIDMPVRGPITETYTSNNENKKSDIDYGDAGSTPTTSRSSMEQIDLEARPQEPVNSLSLKLSPLGPGNEFRGEAWVRRWENMGWWRRVRLRKVWMKEEGLRLMQNRIIIQAELWALIVTVLVEAGVVACPVVGLY